MELGAHPIKPGLLASLSRQVTLFVQHIEFIPAAWDKAQQKGIMPCLPGLL